MKAPFYLFFDVETGGLNSKVNPITQIGYCITDKQLNIVDKKCFYISPSLYSDKFNYTQKALEVSGTTLHEIELHGVNNEGVIEGLELIKTTRKKTNEFYIVGHNIHFDISFFLVLLNLLNVKKEDYLGFDKKSGVLQYIDTLKLTQQVINSSLIDNYKLSTICDYYQIDVADRHNALTDALFCRELLLKINSSIMNFEKDKNKDVDGMGIVDSYKGRDVGCLCRNKKCCRDIIDKVKIIDDKHKQLSEKIINGVETEQGRVYKKALEHTTTCQDNN